MKQSKMDRRRKREASAMEAIPLMESMAPIAATVLVAAC
jgi:hypothetical protein